MVTFHGLKEKAEGILTDPCILYEAGECTDEDPEVSNPGKGHDYIHTPNKKEENESLSRVCRILFKIGTATERHMI